MRPEAKAVGGYYPTPIHLMPAIAALLHVEHAPQYAVLDPCAGDGEAVIELVGALFDEETRRTSVRLYAAELEATRAKVLEDRRSKAGVAYSDCYFRHGDAFALRWSLEEEYGRTPVGASVLYLNPPYDHDPQHKRLEQRFLARFAASLAPGGALVFVVPHYALSASAETLALEFDHVSCARFPDGDFEVFKQVVLVAAKRAPRLAPDPSVQESVLRWAASVDGLPVLDAARRKRGLPVRGAEERCAGFAAFEVAPLDLTAILGKARPWYATDRGGRPLPVRGIVPDQPIATALERVYPIAMPPKPAPIAAGIAAGVFNGARVAPDDPASGLPDILVKGVFDREFVTVDEKHNKDGDKTGEVQVQQPRLVVTALDLVARKYHTLKSSADVTGARSVGAMTTADLLASYGRGLMGVMLTQCPVLHDPARPGDDLPLPALPRSLYRAQAEAVKASVKLLGGARASRRERRGKSVFVLGEIGSGKSTVALATAATIGARRVLIMCPPHLLDSWRDQAKAVVPWARVVVLGDVADVDALAADTGEGMAIAVLSRETAKLGHSWSSVSGQCPACGAPVPDGDLAKKRERCEAKPLAAVDAVASLALRIAEQLVTVAPKDENVAQLFPGRVATRLRERAALKPDLAQWARVRAGALLRGAARRIARSMRLDRAGRAGAFEDALLGLLAAIDDDALTAEVCGVVVAAAAKDQSAWGEGATLRGVARKALLLAKPNGDAQRGVEDAVLARTTETLGYGNYDPAIDWRETRLALASGEPVTKHSYVDLSDDGKRAWKKCGLGSVDALLLALDELVSRGKWRRGAECDEPLFQAVPEPRRYPLAQYVAKRRPDLFDLFVLDEGHEYSGDGTAQGFAAHRLTGLGVPTMLLTGSVMNGYAESLFANQWALDADFRLEFARDERAEFVRRYGYLKQLVEQRDGQGKVVAFGSVTDRVERSARTIGNAPGVLPLFVLRFLLRRAVTLHKSDLAVDIPKCHELVEKVDPGDDLKAQYRKLQVALVAAIKRDRFDPERAGKLWGQMAELPSYLDRATRDCGNTTGGAYVIAYPESVGGQEVVRADPFPAGDILMKERWMLVKVRDELAEGRRVMLFAWHNAVLPRLQRLVEEHLGEKCALLDAGKVQAAKRQAWIDREVVGKDRRVLVVNPVAVQTGLNNLVWFSTILWLQNPGCNPIVVRQANGRIDRIGQKQETRVYWPVYEDTAQETAHRLLLHKVGVSLATDGLDAESALAAAGVGEVGGFDAFSVGRQLYEILAGDVDARRGARSA